MKFVDRGEILNGQASGILPGLGHSLENRVFEPPACIVSSDFCFGTHDLYLLNYGWGRV